MSQYIQYKDTNYIIFQDGKAARLLKPTKAKSGNQHYVNFIVNGKQERVNVESIKEMFAANAQSTQETQG